MNNKAIAYEALNKLEQRLEQEFTSVRRVSEFCISVPWVSITVDSRCKADVNFNSQVLLCKIEEAVESICSLYDAKVKQMKRIESKRKAEAASYRKWANKNRRKPTTMRNNW